MAHILSGVNECEIIKSLANILNTTPEEIKTFVMSQHFRVKCEGISWTYDKLELEHILSYFGIKPSEINLSGITVSHVAAIMDKESFIQQGLLSLHSLFSTENTVRSFLKEHGITVESHADGSLRILVNGVPASTEYLDNRLKRDRCINGFLFGDDPEKDRNISHIKECPEFISHMGRELLHTARFEEEWVARSILSVITFQATIEEIDLSTYYTEFKDSIEMNRAFFVLKAFERLLLKETGYPGNNLMVYLKENINISAERIIQIREITR